MKCELANIKQHNTLHTDIPLNALPSKKNIKRVLGPEHGKGVAQNLDRSLTIQFH